MPHSAILNVMIKAAYRAGRSLKRDLGEIENLQVSLKGPRNFVTAADRKAEAIVREELAKARPDYGFLGEGRLRWVRQLSNLIHDEKTGVLDHDGRD